jgi:hypothetical protein
VTKTIAIIIALSIALAGCGEPRYLGGRYYPTYGVLNESSHRSDAVCYEISFGNVIWGLVLIESVIFPLYFFGFSLYNPVRLKTGDHDDCTWR